MSIINKISSSPLNNKNIFSSKRSSYNIKGKTVSKVNYKAPFNSLNNLFVKPKDFIGPLAPWQIREGEEVQRPQINIPNNDWIFGQKSLETGQFGGNQGSLADNSEKWVDDPKVFEIVSKYYSDFSKEDLELLFAKMRSNGCGYISLINVIMLEYIYRDEIEFKEKFGFNLYELEYDENGKLYKKFNYEYLFLDLYLYVSKQRRFDTIEDVYGNIEEILKHGGNVDEALNNSQRIETTGMTGVYYLDNYMQKYLEPKGIEVQIKTDFNIFIIDKEKDPEAWEKAKRDYYDYLVDLGLNKSYEEYINDEDYHVDTMTYYSHLFLNEVTAEDVSKLLKEGKQVTVAAAQYTLYSVEDIDGNGKLDDIVYENLGAHVMYVVGTTSDGKLVVSSWGCEFVFDPKDIKSIATFDFERKN